tara:strand:- start:528 stop:1487 length:960 start_codon:yes stop_codon:yes gene_type:complete
MLKANNIISIDDLSDEDISAILHIAGRIKEDEDQIRTKHERRRIWDRKLEGLTITNLFYEPSTRTSSSFAAAAQNLGAKLISINDVKYSSVSKGESLPDTIRTLEQYSNAIVLRHPEIGAAAVAQKYSDVPIINAGDGAGEHPTQALLDLFTIQSELGRVNDISVTFVGDLKNGRTVHSLIKLLRRQKGVTINAVSPEVLVLPNYLRETHAFSNIDNVPNIEVHSLEPWLLKETNVLYMTRIQAERFHDPAEAKALSGKCVLTKELALSMPEKSVIMHPLPRVDEIDIEVDELPNAAYFRQVKNGLYVRMAILWLLLGS